MVFFYQLPTLNGVFNRMFNGKFDFVDLKHPPSGGCYAHNWGLVFIKNPKRDWIWLALYEMQGNGKYDKSGTLRRVQPFQGCCFIMSILYPRVSPGAIRIESLRGLLSARELSAQPYRLLGEFIPVEKLIIWKRTVEHYRLMKLNFKKVKLNHPKHGLRSTPTEYFKSLTGIITMII